MECDMGWESSLQADTPETAHPPLLVPVLLKG